MKKTLYYLFFSLFVASLFVSCRKGENDPLISLRSRKARLTGDWILQEGILDLNYDNGSSSTFYITTYSNSSKEINDNGNISNKNFSQRLTLRKDNSFERETIDGTITTTQFGSWSFVNKNKDQEIKNKESIMLSIDSYTIDGITTVNEGVFLSEFLLINRLSNKELIFKGETKRNFTSGEKVMENTNSNLRKFNHNSI